MKQINITNQDRKGDVHFADLIFCLEILMCKVFLTWFIVISTSKNSIF